MIFRVSSPPFRASQIGVVDCATEHSFPRVWHVLTAVVNDGEIPEDQETETKIINEGKSSVFFIVYSQLTLCRIQDMEEK